MAKRSVTPACGDVWIDGDAFLAVAAIGLAAIAFALNSAITMAKRRKKRHSDSPLMLALLGTPCVFLAFFRCFFLFHGE